MRKLRRFQGESRLLCSIPCHLPSSFLGYCKFYLGELPVSHCHWWIWRRLACSSCAIGAAFSIAVRLRDVAVSRSSASSLGSSSFAETREDAAASRPRSSLSVDGLAMVGPFVSRKLKQMHIKSGAVTSSKYKINIWKLSQNRRNKTRACISVDDTVATLDKGKGVS